MVPAPKNPPTARPVPNRSACVPLFRTAYDGQPSTLRSREQHGVTTPEPITSPSNPRVKRAAGLRRAQDRHETGLSLVDGVRELTRAVAAGVEIVEVFVAAEAAADPGRAAAQAACLEACRARGAGGAEIVWLGPRAFEKVAFGDRNEGVVAVIRFGIRPLAEVSFAAGRPVLVAEGVEKPGNLGAILRTADAAGLAGVIACDGGTDATNPAVIRASLGTVFSVPLAAATAAETIAWCRAHNRRVVAATPEGTLAWHELPLAGDTAIVVGSEAHGLSPAWQEAAASGRIELATVTLPMRGIADSLNVSATVAVLAYEALRQERTR
jgi:TrmH family RNA methyltransferase